MKATDIRRGHVIFFEGQPCRVMEFTHRTPGNLRAFVQARMRNLNTGSTFEHRFSATEFVEEARLDTKQLQVLYRDANGVHVMDGETYDQYTLDDEVVGDQGQWMEAGMNFTVEWLNGRPIAIELPAGRHRVVFRNKNLDKERAVTTNVVRGETTTVRVDLTE